MRHHVIQGTEDSALIQAPKALLSSLRDSTIVIAGYNLFSFFELVVSMGRTNRIEWMGEPLPPVLVSINRGPPIFFLLFSPALSNQSPTFPYWASVSADAHSMSETYLSLP